VSAVPTLIVEDEADVAQLIARALEPFGFAVTLVGTAQAALVHCETTPPELAIIDLGLPDRDGLDLLRELQTRYPCAVIILTGRAAVADRVLGLELGADDRAGQNGDAALPGCWKRREGGCDAWRDSSYERRGRTTGSALRRVAFRCRYLRVGPRRH
jgi:CheY-like chemotaxis protein